MHGIGQQRHAAARYIDDDLEDGRQTEGDESDPDGADGEAVIEEGAVAGEIGVAVVMDESGQVQRLPEFDEDVATVMVMVAAVIVTVCHRRRSALVYIGLARFRQCGALINSQHSHRLRCR